MMRRVVAALIVVLFAIVFWRLIGGYVQLQALRPLAEYYVVRGPLELGAPNIVTGILITYRGFDTLGEVAVLFMVAASVGLLLKEDRATIDFGRPDATEPHRRQRKPVPAVLVPALGSAASDSERLYHGRPEQGSERQI